MHESGLMGRPDYKHEGRRSQFWLSPSGRQVFGITIGLVHNAHARGLGIARGSLELDSGVTDDVNESGVSAQSEGSIEGEVLLLIVNDAR